ncbi:ABC transporter permease subunit [Catenulispora subtropica]|uniref:ABC transporter permease subunit n=1 Tax=Catenulispora subtropica TaxID=450798 RepID=A0ABN2TBV1_9ACTN
MTAVAEPTGASGATRRPRSGKVTQTRVLNSEWIKFRSLRSSYWSLLVGCTAMTALGLLFSFVITEKWDTMVPGRRATFGAIAVPLRGYYLCQLAVGVLGVMVVTGEYSTGMIRASLSAVPKRLPVLWAKATVFAAAVWLTTTATAFVCFFGGQAFFSTKHIEATLTTPGAVRIIFGTGLYLTVVGLLGVGLGTIIRTTAGAIAALFATLLVLPVLGEVLNFTSWGDKVNPYLPSNAGQALLVEHTEASGQMRPWPGFVLFVAYAVATMAVAAYLLKKRDA